MLDVARNTGPNMVATYWQHWSFGRCARGRREETPDVWMLHTTCSQHGH
jgi:hypothetical protein